MSVQRKPAKRDRLARTPLHYAVVDHDLAQVIALIGTGAEVNGEDDDGFTPLHLAAQEQLTDIAAALIEAGADVDARDAWGNTPLSRAVFSSRGTGDLIRLLRLKGANPNVVNNHGVSPLALARTISNYDVAQFFRDLP